MIWSLLTESLAARKAKIGSTLIEPGGKMS
jgi:hypothetical protein